MKLVDLVQIGEDHVAFVLERLGCLGIFDQRRLVLVHAPLQIAHVRLLRRKQLVHDALALPRRLASRVVELDGRIADFRLECRIRVERQLVIGTRVRPAQIGEQPLLILSVPRREVVVALFDRLQPLQNVVGVQVLAAKQSNYA